MTALALVLAGLAAALHVAIFVMESVSWRTPSTWRRFGVASQEAADTTAPMAYNQGFYNLFLAIGALVGVVLVLTGPAAAGWALVLSACGSMLLAAVVLLTTGTSYLRAAATQGTLPLLAVVFAVLALV